MLDMPALAYPETAADEHIPSFHTTCKSESGASGSMRNLYQKFYKSDTI
jgi:hypothetical protein